MSVTRMGVVYRCYGDPSITGPIKDGMDAALVPLNARELEVVKAENRKLTAEKGVRAANDADKWPDIQARLARQYQIKQHGALYRRLLVCWAMMWFEIGRFYQRMSEWNREG